jgi:bifunctional DNase/RNase
MTDSGLRSTTAMYERFTDRARKVMQLANQEAQRFNHEYIGTEHILLGLVKEGSGVAANVLKNLDVDLQRVRLEVEKLVQSGPDMVTAGKLPQTPRAKKVIEYAVEESRKLKHNYVGTEHILLGLLREDAGVAAQVLMNLGLGFDPVRAGVMSLLGYPSDEEKDATAHLSAYCESDTCINKATVHLTYVKDRRCDHQSHYCALHARMAVESFVKMPAVHSVPPAVLPDATDFDVSLVGISEAHKQNVVFLREVGGSRLVRIKIGLLEAVALDSRIRGLTPPRPLAHDAMETIIRAVGVSVQDVVIEDVEDRAYHAKMRLPINEELRSIDLPPSDALVLAVAFDCPIFVTDDVLEKLTEAGEIISP